MKAIGENMLVIIGLMLLLAVVVCFIPAVLLWSVNSLAQAGGADFHIPHNWLTYFQAWAVVCIIGGSSRAAGK